VRYFGDHDEVYWNVTGNGWMFRIDQASARITLPDGARFTETVAYTGPLGAVDTNAEMRINGNMAVFATTRPLQPREGLTIVAGFPKGVVAPPSGGQQRSWWLRDNINLILGFGALALVVLYYARNWTRVGRDPAEGVMEPRWDPPDGASPALVNYIDNKGFSGKGWTAISASALDLAVKGYVTLDDLKNSITIRRTDKSPNWKLPTGQAALLKEIPSPGDELVIDKANGSRVQTVGSNFRRAMEKEHRDKYYRANTGYVIGGVLLSILALGALFLFGNVPPDMIAILLVPVFFAAVFGTFAVKLGQAVRRGKSLFSRIMAVIVLGFIGLVALSMISGAVVAFALELSGLG